MSSCSSRFGEGRHAAEPEALGVIDLFPLSPSRASRLSPSLVLVAAALAACRGPTDVTPNENPDLRRAVAYAPPPAYRFWWGMVEACTGRRGDLSAVRFAVVPGASELTPVNGQPAVGVWLPSRRTVLLAGGAATDGETVRHEMLHALLEGTADAARVAHPYEYFGRRCAGEVHCPGDPRATGCGAEIAAQAPPAPAGTRDVPSAQLAVSVATVPAGSFPSDTNGGAFAVVVSVTNPLAEPVWVGAADPVPPGGAATGFAFSTPVRGTVERVPGGRMLLLPGETRRRVFDLTTDAAGFGSGFRPGAFDVTGQFGTVTSAPLTVRIDPPRATRGGG